MGDAAETVRSQHDGRPPAGFEDIDCEIARLAVLCKTSILQEATLKMLHYGLRERACETLGTAEAQVIINLVVGRIRERFDKLGIGPPGS
jgi:hypothetical protein